MERLREKSRIENEENNGKKAEGVGNKERVIAEFKGDADLRIRELDVKGGCHSRITATEGGRWGKPRGGANLKNGRHT